MLVLFNQHAIAQEQEEEEPKSAFAVSFGYSHVPAGSALGATETEGVFVPSIGIDYGILIAKKWEVGVMIDFELDHYLIFNKELERDKALIIVAGGGYNPIAHLVIITGAGIELEKNENLFVYRLGVNYSIRLNRFWALVPSTNFDYKQHYISYVLSIGLKYKLY